MLLGKLHSDFLEDVSVVALESGIKSAVTVDYDEAELLIICKEALERRGVEFVSAVVEGLVDGAEGLDIVVDLLLGLAVLHEDHTAEDHKAVGGGVSVELQLLLGGCDGSDDRLAGLAGLNVLGLGELLSEAAGG